MSDERHSGLGQQLPHADSDGDLLKRRQLLRRARIGVVVVLVLLGAGVLVTGRGCDVSSGRVQWSGGALPLLLQYSMLLAGNAV